MRNFIRYLGQVAAAAGLGGAVAAGGVYAVSTITHRTSYWGSPRSFYQMLFGTEAAWLAGYAVVVFATSALIGYLFRKKPRPAGLRSPAHLAFAVALTGGVASYLLANYDEPWMYGHLVKAGMAVAGALTLFWGLAGWLVYKVSIRVALAVPFKLLAAAVFLGPAAAEVGFTVAERPAAGPRRPDVYIIVMDAFRADRLTPYGAAEVCAPFLEGLASRSLVFTNAYAGSSWTRPATATLFTSLPPSAHGVRAPFNGIPAAAPTLASQMRAAGYRTIGISANGNLSRFLGMAAGFDVMDDIEGGSFLEAAGPPLSLNRVLSKSPWMPAALRPWFSSSRDGAVVNRRFALWRRLNRGAPCFYYLHYMEPHNPNRVCPACRPAAQPYLDRITPAAARRIQTGTYFLYEVFRDPAFRIPFNADEVALARLLYDCEIRKMDEVVKAWWEAAAPPDDALVVITADHGEEFGEHGRWLHGTTLHCELARVPLLVRGAGVRAGEVSVPVSLMDVAPTVVTWAGTPLPKVWRGQNLGVYFEGGGRGSHRGVLVEGTRDLRPRDGGPGPFGVETDIYVDGDYYYLYDVNARREYLYDVVADPRQRRDLSGERDYAKVLLTYRAAYKRAKAAARTGVLPPSALILDAETEHSLKALGYL